MIRISTLPLAVVLAWPSLAVAETHVFVRNRTSHELRCEISTHLDREYWRAGARSIPPGTRHKVLSFNRQEGIKKGREFLFSVDIAAVGLSGLAVSLRQKLLGQFYGSHLWQSAGDNPLCDDRNAHAFEWQLGPKVLRILYRAREAGLWDDIEYVFIEYPDRPPSTTQGNTFDILAYNIFMRSEPLGLLEVSNEERADMLTKRLAGYDALVLSEAFDDDVRDKLIENLKDIGYKYFTPVLSNPQSPLTDNGGVLVGSPFRIDTFEPRFFRQALGADALADKGVMYARIVKEGKPPFHIFATHTQSGNGADHVRVRSTQLHRIRRFVEEKKIPSDEAVFIAGDLNVDRSNPERDRMLDILGAKHPVQVGHPFTVDPMNDLVSDSEARQYLDYVLWSTGHLQPKKSFNKTLILASPDFYSGCHVDLSDHFPVWGHFEF